MRVAGVVLADKEVFEATPKRTTKDSLSTK